MIIQDVRRCKTTPPINFLNIPYGTMFQGTFLDPTNNTAYTGTFFKGNSTITQMDGERHDSWGLGPGAVKAQIHKYIVVYNYQAVHGRIVIERNA